MLDALDRLFICVCYAIERPIRDVLRTVADARFRRQVAMTGRWNRRHPDESPF